MCVFAEFFHRQTDVDVTAIVVTAIGLERDGFAVDDQVIVAYLDAVARQPDQALDVIDARIGRKTEHHHVAALRRTRRDELLVDHRQAQAIGVLVHHDEIAIEQRGHHRI